MINKELTATKFVEVIAEDNPSMYDGIDSDLELEACKEVSRTPRSNSGSLSRLGYQTTKILSPAQPLPEPRSDHRVTPTRPPASEHSYSMHTFPHVLFFFGLCKPFLPVVLKAGIRKLLVGLVPASWFLLRAVAKGRLQAPLLGPSWSSLCVPVSGAAVSSFLMRTAAILNWGPP